MHRKVAAALVAALALAGCGGSGTTTTTVGRAEAVRRLEAACLAGQREAQKAYRTGHDRATAVRGIRVDFETVMDRIGGLETTGAAKADFDAYKATVRTRLDALARVTATADADVEREMRAVESVLKAGRDKAFEAVNRLGAEHVCI